MTKWAYEVIQLAATNQDRVDGDLNYQVTNHCLKLLQMASGDLNRETMPQHLLVVEVVLLIKGSGSGLSGGGLITGYEV